MKTEKASEFLEKIKNKIIVIAKEAKIPLILVAILLVADLILGMISRAMIGNLPDQNTVSRCSYEHCAQVSAFFGQDRYIDEDFIKKMEYDFKNKITESGISEKKLKYSSCYSAQGAVSLSFEDKNLEEVDAIGVAGDFFLFHPLKFVSGGPFINDPVMADYIVIDTDIAWKLFGSNDVVDEIVYIGDVPHYIAGVVERPEGRISDAAGLKDPVIYMTYDSLSKYGNIYSGRTTEKEISEDGKKAKFGGINCYEIVCTNPVEGIVRSNIAESCGLDGRFVHICENSERFKALPLLEVVASFGTRSMWQKAIYYPYWENIARGYEDILSIFFVIRLFLKVSACVTVILFVRTFYVRKETDLHGLLEKLADKKYELEVKLNERKKNKRKAKWEKDELPRE